MRTYLFIGAVSASIGAVLLAGHGTSADYAAVHGAIDAYFEGAKTATAEPFEKAWDLENGRMVYVRQKDGVETTHSVPIKKAIEGWTSKPPEASWGRVHSIEILDGQIAVAKVEMLYRGQVYVDVLSLYKVNGDWKIVNKMFVRREHATTGP